MTVDGFLAAFREVVSFKQGAPMFEGLFQPMHLLVLLGIALLVFGPKKLPELGKGLGDGIRIFKSSIRGDEEETGTSEDRVSTRVIELVKSSDSK